MSKNSWTLSLHVFKVLKIPHSVVKAFLTADSDSTGRNASRYMLLRPDIFSHVFGTILAFQVKLGWATIMFNLSDF